MTLRLHLIAALVLAACGHRDAAPPGEAASLSPSGADPLPRLDDPAHELAVLDAEIDDWRRRAATDPPATAALVDRLLRRASVRGRLEDYLEADRASAAWLAAAPRDRRAHVVRAQVHARVHRFGAARDELAAAVAAGAPPGQVEPLAVAIAQATGDPARAVRHHRRAVSLSASPGNLVGLAMALADGGDLDGALVEIERAWQARRGGSPLAAAALLFQWGRLHEEAGALAAARDRYELAVRALPQHVEATAHLAGVLARTGERDRAIELLEALVAAYPYPEAQGDLSILLASREPARSRQLAADAAAGFARWVDALPEAFAGHAARFHLASTHQFDPDLAASLRASARGRSYRDSRSSR
jgi:tetratricopeptide (TPR) repeat protein